MIAAAAIGGIPAMTGADAACPCPCAVTVAGCAGDICATAAFALGTFPDSGVVGEAGCGAGAGASGVAATAAGGGAVGVAVMPPIGVPPIGDPPIGAPVTGDAANAAAEGAAPVAAIVAVPAPAVARFVNGA
jgi:hypothetical protein